MKTARLGCALMLVATNACFCEDPLLEHTPAPDVEVVDEQDNRAGSEPPLILEFGDVEIGSRASRRVRVRNTGNAPLAIERLGPLVDATDPICPFSSAEFGYPPIGGSQGVEVDPGGERTIEVGYRPQDGGGDCAIMEVRSNDADQPAIRVYFRARGSAARFCATQSVLDFGDVVLGQMAELTTEISNCGIRPLTVTNVTTGAEFPPFELVTAVPTPREFQPGEALSLTVRFTPTQAARWGGAGGTRPAGLILFETAEVGAGSLTLQGRGVPPPRCLLTVAPSAINLGQVAVGATADRDVLLSNGADAPCTVTTIERTAGSTDFSVSAGGAPPTLNVAPFSTTTFTIHFAPTTGGLQNATFTVTSPDNQNTAPLVVNVEANQPPPQGCALVADPSFVNFGVVPTGSVTSRTITLNSVGTEDCSLREVTVTSGAPDFSTTSQPTPIIGTIIPSGNSATVNVDVRPVAPGPKVGRLHLVYKQFGFGNPNQTLDVDLAANAQAPALCVTPDPLDFGTVPTGSEIRRSVAIQSCGAAPLNIRGLHLGAGSSPAFDVPAAPGLPVSLDPGTQLNVEVRYRPTTAAGDLGLLVIASDDPAQPTVNIRLLGNAVGLCPPLMRCQPQALVFGNVEVGLPMTQTVVCTNFGVQSVAITSATVSPMPPFTSTAALPTTLAPGQSVTVQVSVNPTAQGPITGTLTVQSNACETMQTVQLVATGIPPVVPACEPPTNFSPQEEWAWTQSTVHPLKDQVWMTPLVINLTDDNGDGAVSGQDIPDVIFVTFDARDFNMNPADPNIGAPVPGVLRAVSGDDGHELWTVVPDVLMLQSEAQIAAGDIDGDNLPEIIGSKFVLLEGEADIPMGPKVRGRFVRGRLLCFAHDGSFRWESDEWTASKDDLEDGGGPALADLDQDGFSEIIYRNHVFDHEGHLLWAGSGGSGNSGHGAMPVPVDLDGDGRLEVAAGNTAYRADGSELWRRTDVADGQPAVVDFEGDGTPEVVIHNGKIHILNGEDGTDAYPAITLPFPMSGCMDENDDDCSYVIPTHVAIADFDNDGLPELAVSNKNLLVMLEANGQEHWRVNISDQTGASGPAAFDFEGDGIYEVVYADESNAYALRGTTGQNIYTAPRSSRTIFEYAVVADADNDGHANLVVAQNEPLLRTARGVKMLGNTAGRWAASSRVWNQHAYHITNVTENGTIPRVEARHYQGGRALNTFRSQAPRCQ